MTTYRAIGKYAIDATDGEKRRALTETLCEASIELVDLGMSLDDLERWHDEAMARAEYELEQLRAAPSPSGKERSDA